MERMYFKIEVPEEVLQERNKLIKELKRNTLVQDFCKNNGCDMSLVENYPYRFKKWLEGIALCQKCTSLSVCRQENIGKVYDLQYEGYLEFVLRPCRFAKKKKEEEAHLTNITINDMPAKFYALTMDQLDIDADNMGCIKEVTQWLENPSQKGLYLRGPVGTGKSTLASVVCGNLAKKGKRCAYVNVPSWVGRMKLLFEEPEEIQREIRILSKADFVVFDDIGAETATAWVRDDLLFPILNARMENSQMTWFTSNEDFESLEAHYAFNSKFGEEKMKAVRIMERIKTLAKSVDLSGKNRRNQ